MRIFNKISFVFRRLRANYAVIVLLIQMPA